MECTKVNCPMQAGTPTDNCGENCPWRITAKTGDLISRAAAHEMVKGMQKWCITLPGNPRKTQVGYMSDDVRFGLDRLPAVDAVPVIRCRDCKRSIENAKHIDVACERSYDPDFYCAAGERRDSE